MNEEMGVDALRHLKLEVPAKYDYIIHIRNYQK